MGASASGDGPGGATTRCAADARPPSAGSIVACVERAREGARTVRDVISAEMWEAINTLTWRSTCATWRRRTADGGPYLAFSYVKERSALFWGLTDRTMLRDEARRSSSPAGGSSRADMVLRMLRVALPAPGGTATDAEPGVRDGQALALLQAVGGFQAFRRAVPAPPNAGPVARFLLFERAYPDTVAASVDALHESLERRRRRPRDSEPVLRLSRLAPPTSSSAAGAPAAEDGNLAEASSAVQQRARAGRPRRRRALLRGAGAAATRDRDRR